MTDTALAELIARLREQAKARPTIYSWENETHQLEWKAAGALAAQAQEIGRLASEGDAHRRRADREHEDKCRYIEQSEAHYERAEAAEARVRELEEELSTDWPEWASKRNEQVKGLIADRDAIEAKTIELAASICDKYRDNEKVIQHEHWAFTYCAADEIAAAIRALRHIGREG